MFNNGSLPNIDEPTKEPTIYPTEYPDGSIVENIILNEEELIF